MVLYRKYRPQKLGELDSESVKTRLLRIFSSSFIPHAFLFTGSRGTGKTSAARIVAKLLNCEKRTIKKDNVILGTTQSDARRRTPESRIDSGQARMTIGIEPCNNCETCKSITEGRHLDILEIDAASNRGIEEIRDLREKIKLAPISAAYKVYIIDEVHMLTNEAFNALLKTLEEPPSHAIFILATTEAEKLPVTIISRCIRINFQKATDDEIVNCLRRVVKGEKIEFSDENLKLIARASDGSFRDATKIIEQAILENALTKEKINSLLGKQNFSPQDFLMILATGNTQKVLEEITHYTANGVNYRILTEELLNFLHGMLMANYGLKGEEIHPKLYNVFSKTEIVSLIRLFSKVYTELKNTNIPALPWELAVVEWCENKVKS